MKPTAQVGGQAPEFTLQDSDGNYRALAEFKGKKIVLYFFPKADTPGCTQEACSFRETYTDYQDKGIIVLGVSYDSPEELKKFKDKYRLPFVLLSDSEKNVAKEYGAYTSLLNFFYPERMTFLIDESGIITHILTDVNVINHAQDILALIHA